MAISRSYASGWGVGEKVTSAQLNTLDTNTTYAVDKRSGQQDIFASMLVATGAGRVVKSVQTGPDGNKTFHVQDGNSIVRVPTLTAARTYTVGQTGATGGDSMLFYVEGTGATASGYADIVNNQGTGLFRLGATKTQGFNDSAEGDAVEIAFSSSAQPSGAWVLMYGAGPGMRHVEFAGSTTWVCPPGVFEILLLGYGGGGGGGTGGVSYDSGDVTAHRTSGGGGGGGSQLRVQRIAVVPRRSYTITIGAGGATDADGGDTTIADGASTLATFAGAGRGLRGGVLLGVVGGTGGVTGTCAGIALGGAGTRIFFVSTGTSVPTGSVIGVPSMIQLEFGADRTPYRGPVGVGAGGPGVTGNFPAAFMRAGWYSAEGYAGGTGGKHGVDGSLNVSFGGGGGGGGGGGPAGIGGYGGTGGDDILGAIGKNGVAGGTGIENSGAGGGGGGGAAHDAVFGPGLTPGLGGQGGSGKLTIVFFK